MEQNSPFVRTWLAQTAVEHFPGYGFVPARKMLRRKIIQTAAIQLAVTVPLLWLLVLIIINNDLRDALEPAFLLSAFNLWMYISEIRNPRALQSKGIVFIQSKGSGRCIGYARGRAAKLYRRTDLFFVTDEGLWGLVSSSYRIWVPAQYEYIRWQDEFVDRRKNSDTIIAKRGNKALYINHITNAVLREEPWTDSLYSESGC